MKRPSLVHYLIGNPVALLTASGLLVAALYQWWVDQLDWPAPAIMALITNWSYKAFERIDAFRSWKREWEGMETRPRRLASATWRRTIGAISWVAFGAYLYTHREDSTHLLVLMGVIGWTVLAGVFFLFRWVRTRRAQARQAVQKQPLVSIAITEPLLPLPPLEVAYQRLPQHCHAALRPPAKTARPLGG